MGTFQIAKARIGASRLLLDDLKGESRRTASLLQSNALLEVLLCESRGKDLGAEMRASLGTAICAAKFEEDHQAALLAALSGQKVACRRQAQDAMNAFQYFSKHEWDRLEEYSSQCLIQQLILDVVVGRLHCVNPTEPTIKLLTSAMLVLRFGDDMCDVTLEEKDLLKKAVAKRVKAMARKLNGKVVDYCTYYPACPGDLAAKHPALYERIQVEGGFTQGRLSEKLMAKVEASYGCRSNDIRFASAPMNVVPQMQSCMKMLMGMMQSKLPPRFDRRRESEDECELEFLHPSAVHGGRKRSLIALADAPRLKRRSLSMPSLDFENEKLAEEKLAIESDAAQLADERLAAEKLAAEQLAAKRLAAEKLVAEKLAAEQLAAKRLAAEKLVAEKLAGDELLAEAAGSMKVDTVAAKNIATEAAVAGAVPAEVADVTSAAPESRKSKAISLLDAMLDREKERRESAKVKAAAKKAAEKADKVATASAEKGAVKGGGKAAVKAAPLAATTEKGAVKGGGEGAVKAPKLPVKSDAEVKKPSFSHERSRSQYLCRTGAKGPGGSFQIKYGAGTGLTEEAARDKAEAWLKEKKMGSDCV